MNVIFSGDSINPFDNELITKLLQRVIKFPSEKHLSGYIEYKSDMPSMRSEFKLGMIIHLNIIILFTVINITSL